ncbi:hypothetical protein WJ22_26395 [Burkholderia vietnamiensis]|nr:hypothetical protein WJ18_18585 [Burkholderia vietnamiensis]KVF84300.1 hypothetical protein WJ19_18970 [Burkholderia vietnamiensis]KVF90201.1 hypothetical protein WJ20_14025 [Burkholderia vietnamiensis]KVF96244.1 hypothetical protein WJ22_26395 [Burkholderia vietnamiensis]
MTARDGRIIAREREQKLLHSLSRFGFLRTRDCAALRPVWGRGATGEPNLEAPVATASDVRMAQRTLRRLFEAHQVLRGQGPDGSVIYALAEAGARRLQQAGIAATTGKDLVRAFSSAHFRHRTIANEIAIRGLLDGYKIESERELSQGKSVIGDGIAAKKPDVLLRGADKRIFWIEVERSRKNAKDYAKLLKWLDTVAADAADASGSKLLGAGLRWGKVIFVCTRAFRAKLTRDLIAKGWKKSALDALIRFETTLYRFEDIVFA